MKEIFKGTVYDMIRKPDGIVFSYLEETLSDGLFIKFKMIDAHSGAVTDIAKNIYLIGKFGSNYRPAVKLCDNFITAKTIVLPSGKLFICKKNGECYLIDSDGAVLWNGIILYHDNPPSDIALYNNSIWASFYEDNALVRFNIENMREELRIGGEHSPFLGPRGIFIEGKTATVSNMVSKTLAKINLDTYAVEQYYEFEQGVKNYIKEGIYEFVQLESGIYSI